MKVLISIFILVLSVQAFASNTLSLGESLTQNGELLSNNGDYYALMQEDGNFCVYAVDGSSEAVWSAGSNGDGLPTTGNGPFTLTIEEGDFEVTNGAGSTIWTSPEIGSGDGTNNLVLQNNGTITFNGIPVGSALIYPDI